MKKKKKGRVGAMSYYSLLKQKGKKKEKKEKKKGGGEGGRDVARLWLQRLQQAMQAYPPLLPSSSSPKARAKLGLV